MRNISLNRVGLYFRIIEAFLVINTATAIHRMEAVKSRPIVYKKHQTVREFITSCLSSQKIILKLNKVAVCHHTVEDSACQTFSDVSRLLKPPRDAPHARKLASSLTEQADSAFARVQPPTWPTVLNRGPRWRCWRMVQDDIDKFSDITNKTSLTLSIFWNTGRGWASEFISGRHVVFMWQPLEKRFYLANAPVLCRSTFPTRTWKSTRKLRRWLENLNDQNKPGTQPAWPRLCDKVQQW